MTWQDWLINLPYGIIHSALVALWFYALYIVIVDPPNKKDE